jgi:hypothetical protein
LVRCYPRIFQILLIIACIFLAFIVIKTPQFSGCYKFWLLFIDSVIIVLCLAQLSSFLQGGRFNKFGKLKSISVLNNIGKDSSKQVPKEVKESEISILSFLVGLFISYCFDIDLISLFNGLISNNSPDNLILGRSETPIDLENFRFASGYTEFNHLAFIGYLMTGFFLAFGSKFFHDLLDTLLQIKELKRKLNDKETYNVSNIKDFDAQLSLIEKDMVKATFDRKSSAIMALEGVIGCSCGTFSGRNGKDVFGIKIYTSKPELILEESFSYLMPNGNAKVIPVYVEDQPMTAKICTSLRPSDKARHKLLPDSIGSICFSVRSKSDVSLKYLLTCYHVVKGPNHSWEAFYRAYNDNDKSMLNGIIESDIYRGIRTREMDAALIEMDAGWSFDNKIPEFGIQLKSSRPVFYFDDDKTTVNIYGAASRRKTTGVITGIGACYKIDFGDANPFEMVNLFEIQNNNKSIVVAGDSGSIVFTDKGEALGMVVATTPTTTLAIPIETILTTWNLELDIKTQYNL